MQIKMNNLQSFGMHYTDLAQTATQHKSFSPKLLEYFDSLSKIDDEYLLETLTVTPEKSAKFKIANMISGCVIEKTVSKKKICSFVKSLLDGDGLDKLFKRFNV